MTEDPAGFYARLGVAPTAPLEAIIAAYRAKARVLHPDIPGTGDAAAFMRMKEAYDVLADVERRAAYDRSARAAAPMTYAMPEVDDPAWPTPRFWDLTMVLWIVLAGGLTLASVMVVVELVRSASAPPPPMARTFVPTVPTTRPEAAALVAVPVGGVASHYVLPGGGTAVVWRRDASNDSFHPGGRIADFSAVQALRRGAAAWAGRDPAGGWRQRVHRCLAADAGRSPDGAARLLRLQRRRSATERRGAVAARTGFGRDW